MRFLLQLVIAVLWAWPLLAQAPVISPTTPVVNQGATQAFTCTANCGGGGTWSCSGTDNTGAGIACRGSINSSTGIYSAPASVTAQQSLGGYQLLPNNHIFNTRIDTLPVNANSATWLNRVNQGLEPFQSDTWVGMPINYVTPSTPTEAMSFYYNPANNGTFRIPKFPDAKLEHGYFNARYGNPFNADHHLFTFDTSNGKLAEFYQWYTSVSTTAASVTGNVATLTFPLDLTKNIFVAGELVCVGTFSGTDVYFNVCPVTLTGATATTISYALAHADATATTNGNVTANTQVTNACSTAGTCTSQSGLAYNYSDYALPANQTTSASGVVFQPLLIRLQEMLRAVATGGTINHALSVTYAIGDLANSFIWPATQFANDPGPIPFGARLRLKSSFDISGYSAIAQVLLKQAQQYGYLVVDGGIRWDLNGEGTAWPKAYVDAMNEVNSIAGTNFTITNTQISGNVLTTLAANTLSANNVVRITGTTNCGGALNFNNYVVTSATSSQFTAAFTHADCAAAADTGTAHEGITNFFEFVDESGLMVSSTSGVTTRNREIVTFTRTSDSASSSVDVALQGVAVNFTSDYLYIQAGTPAQQLTALVNIGGVTWTMSPSVGTLTSGGFFTPPTTLASTVTSTFTATSTVNAAVAAQLNVVVYPGGTIRVIPSQDTDFTDSLGNVWTGGYTATSQPGTRGCCAGPNFSTGTDHQLWNFQLGYSSQNPGETRIDLTVPNGTYQIVHNYGTQVAAGVAKNKVSQQGRIVFDGDFAALAGGLHKAYTTTVMSIVNNNKLSYVVWNVNDQGAPISSLQVSRVGSVPPWFNVVDQNRAIDWSRAGADPAIMGQTRPQCGSTITPLGTLGSPVAATSINTAIASCAAAHPLPGVGGYVLLSPGSFFLNGPIDFGHSSNVSLRGSGANSTFLVFSIATTNTCAGFGGANVCLQPVNNGDGGDQNYNNQASWTVGYVPGTTSITLGTPFTKGSIAGLQVGSLIFLDQLDDISPAANGVVVCQVSSCGGGGSGNGRNWRPSTQEEPQIVTSISGSGPWQIGISPGIRVPNISGTRSPQMWSNSGLPIQNDGIENMSIDTRNSQSFSNIFCLDCYNVWAKGLRLIGQGLNGNGTYQFYAYQSKNVTFRDNYGFGSASTSNNYMFSCWAGADVLYENNISQHMAFSYMSEGCLGGVTAYNFVIDNYYTGTPAGTATEWQQNGPGYHHGSGDMFNLFEGNEGFGVEADNVHGSSNLSTAFRNFYSGRDLNGGSVGGKTLQTTPVLLYAYNRAYNVIGNVLGTASYHNTYQCAYPSPSTCGNTAQIYSLGYAGDASASDTYTPTSLMRWGNYDVVNNATRFVGAEVPSGLTDGFVNSVPQSNVLPASFFKSSKPSWWGVVGQPVIPWPAVGPDVTGGNVISGSGAASTLGGHAYHIPAGVCYFTTMLGPLNGAATLLNFDPSLCYVTSSGGGSGSGSFSENLTTTASVQAIGPKAGALLEVHPTVATLGTSAHKCACKP